MSRWSALPGARGGARFQHADAWQLLGPWLNAGRVRLGDIAVLDAATGRFPMTDSPLAALAFALAIGAPRGGHVGVDLQRWMRDLRTELRSLPNDGDGPEQADREALAAMVATLPESAQRWHEVVKAHSCVSSPQARSEAPFILQPLEDGDSSQGARLLMTNRMWRQQRRLADALLAMASAPPAFVPPGDALQGLLRDVYGEAEASAEARAAAATVAARRLSVITGGPGTGKTWGIKRILGILLQLAAAQGRRLSIALAAPTGKAAVRMAEALADESSIAGLPPETVAKLLKLQPTTLHKLLGVLPYAPDRFRHGMRAPLAADIVVVDEASMIDLQLMRHLAEAIAPGHRLVLLGDRDQLASVDAGTVLADLVGVATESADGPLRRCVARLTVSYRFREAAAIACAAEGLQSAAPADLDAAVDLLCGRPPTRPAWRARIAADPADAPDQLRRAMPLIARDSGLSAAPTPRLRALPDATLDALAGPWLDNTVDNLRHRRDEAGTIALPAEPGYAALLALALAAGDVALLCSTELHASLLQALDRYRVLAAHRRGPLGVEGLNAALSERLRARLQAAAHTSARPATLSPHLRSGAHWLGQPLLVTENSYHVDLRNGDVGLVVLRRGADGALGLQVAFPDPRAEGRPPVRYLTLARMPPHETGLAMTVHKSQGSQFERVTVVLPERPGSPILTRELIYTAVTRARWMVRWLGDEAVLRDAVHRDIGRASGLRPLLSA